MFVKIGARIINLSNVTQVFFHRDPDGRRYIQVSFVGDEYFRAFSGTPEYDVLDTWINDQTHIKQHADVYTRIANALELLERR